MSRANSAFRAYRPWYKHLYFTTAQTTVTLKSARSSTDTLWVQRIICVIKTDAAQSVTFQDSAGTPLYCQKVTTSPGADTTWIFDFGDRGMPLTTGANLTATFSAAGLAGHIEVEGYHIPSTTRDPYWS